MAQKINCKKIIKTILWVTINLFCFMGIFICVYLYQSDEKVLQKDNGCIYFALQHESNPFSSEIQQVADFKSELENTDLFQYYEIYGQPLYSSDTYLPEYESEQKMEDGMYDLAAVQIGPDVLKDFGVALQEGVPFNRRIMCWERIKESLLSSVQTGPAR
ncbi:MAG: hypothetical protein J6D08_16285 [Lachnospiraceae bacterium]|nr:hypothetical protein [Lachnospiraceae bacterium]